MIENTATYDFQIENEIQSLERGFQGQFSSTKIRESARRDAEENLGPLNARERKAMDNATFMSGLPTMRSGQVPPRHTMRSGRAEAKRRGPPFGYAQDKPH
ncbi:MAG TPA: hypothetical protein VGR72_10990 [Candidatus Acidoferrales bacterium]|nr:hypothetical protein [Candidatus Acidoferrales bacterium]